MKIKKKPFRLFSKSPCSWMMSQDMRFVRIQIFFFNFYPKRRYCKPRPAPDFPQDFLFTSNSWSMPVMFCTKYWNFILNMSSVCLSTERKLALPWAIRSSCSSTADLK